MATVIDVPSSLGEYMLRGWVLTDKICSRCSRVPLMRSPSSTAAETHFCVNCDSVKGTEAVGVSRTLPSQSNSVKDELSASSNNSGMSRSSTPPTEVSDAPSSPVFAPVVDPAEVLRRRHQSDTASTEIGRRMLNGWAMLADECPGPDCYGIPLVRPPKFGLTTDPRKECVICGIVYMDEKDIFGQDRLVPIQPSPSPADTYQDSTIAAAVSPPIFSPAKNKGKVTANLETSVAPNVPYTEQVPGDAPAPPDLPTPSAIEASVRSLERSLLVLSRHLDHSIAGPTIDPMSIGQTADTILKVSQALAQVKQLPKGESRALLG